MHCLHSMVAIVFITAFSATATALDQSRINDTSPLERADDDPHHTVFTGMVMHDTMTRTGEAFYRSFSSTWQAADMPIPGTISIIERPSARWGSLIRVKLDSQLLHESVVQSHGDQAEDLGSNIARDIIARLGAGLITRDLFEEDSDLGRREI